MFGLTLSLLAGDAIGQDEVGEAVLASARDGVSLVRALIVTGAAGPRRLAPHLECNPTSGVGDVQPADELVRKLPAGLCERLLAVPLGRDPLTGVVDLAVVDVGDPHAAEEVGYWLGAPVRMVATPIEAMATALRLLMGLPQREPRSTTEPPMRGTAGDNSEPTLRFGSVGGVPLPALRFGAVGGVPLPALRFGAVGGLPLPAGELASESCPSCPAADEPSG